MFNQIKLLGLIAAFTSIGIGMLSCQSSKTRKELLAGVWVLDSIQLSSTQGPEITVVKPLTTIVASVGSNTAQRKIVFSSEGLYYDTLLRPKEAWHWTLPDDSVLILKSFTPAFKHYATDRIRLLGERNLVLTEVVNIYHENYCVCSSKTIMEELEDLPYIDSGSTANSISANDLSVDMIRSPQHDSLLKMRRNNFNQMLFAVQNDIEDTITTEAKSGYFSKDEHRQWCSKIIIKKVKFFHRQE